MGVEELLIQAAVDQVDRRWPDEDGVAAAIRVASGEVLTGTSLSNFNAAMTLCAETGPICTAYSNGQKLVASVCMRLDRSSSEVTVLAPCGACQKRLAMSGPQVEVADSARPNGWSNRTLLELQPFYWATAWTQNPSWPTAADHEE